MANTDLSQIFGFNLRNLTWVVIKNLEDKMYMIWNLYYWLVNEHRFWPLDVKSVKWVISKNVEYEASLAQAHKLTHHYIDVADIFIYSLFILVSWFILWTVMFISCLFITWKGYDITVKLMNVISDLYSQYLQESDGIHLSPQPFHVLEIIWHRRIWHLWMLKIIQTTNIF